jgi:hypothetical protein
VDGGEDGKDCARGQGSIGAWSRVTFVEAARLFVALRLPP